MRLPVKVVFLALLALPLQAQEREPGIAPGIAPVIEGQMQAFRAGDVAGAFAFASPSIQSIFGSAENFGRMVAQGYPMVWQPGAVRMLGQQDQPGMVLQRVLVTDAEGRGHVLEYQMLETAEGWLINGVRIVTEPEPVA
ncbi:MAG: DUF4864 domain-containing protein [Gemmobacter sp.]